MFAVSSKFRAPLVLLLVFAHGQSPGADGWLCRRQLLRVGAVLGIGLTTGLVVTEPNLNPERHWDPTLPPQSCLVERGGHDRIGRFKWFAAGSGVLISPRHVLTAAHVAGVEASVRFRIICPGQPAVETASSVIEPGYLEKHRRLQLENADAIESQRASLGQRFLQETRGTDLAIFELSSPSSVEPMALPEVGKPVSRREGVFYGFGKSSREKAGNHHAYPAHFSFLMADDWGGFGSRHYILARNLKLGTGDSGGGLFIEDPLLKKKVVVGIATGTADGDSFGGPISTFVSVADNLVWIQSQIK